MTLRLRTLGGLALLDDGGPVRGAAGRGRNLALMALLGRAGETGMTRDKLAAYLWPESDQGRARHSLDQAFYTLRQAIGAEAFVTVGDGVGLDGARVYVDASAFSRAVDAGDLHRAVALYGGPFLDGFHISASAEFERWADGHRAALENRYVLALETLARAADETGDNRAALDHWRRLVAVSPLSSRVVLELMRALERAGDRARALDVARTHTALVREELGTRADSSVESYAAELELSADSSTPPQEGEPGAGSTSQQGEAASANTSAGWTAEEPRHPGLESPQARPEPMGRSPVRVAWVAAATALVLAISAGLVVSRRPPAQTTPARVGVPVFQNHTNDPAFDVFGQMAADWVVESLARTGLVEVVGPGGDMAAVASVVEGRVYRSGDSVWIQASVRSPADGLVVRALEPVGADASAPVRALEPLRQQVLGAMGTLYDPRMRAWTESALRPPSFEAYREFAAGIDRYRARDLPGMAARFRRSVEIDPDYLAARLWLAWTSLMRDDLATADSLVTALDPQRERMSPLERAWHDRQLAIVRGDNQASYAAAKRMARLAPRSGWVVALADAALAVNRPDEAIAALEKAGLDALGPARDHGSSLLTFAYHMVGDYARELAVTEETIRALGLDWDFVGPGVRALAAGGRANALEERLDQLRNQPPGPYGAFRGPTSLRAAVVELRAHGHEDAAVALVNRTLSAEKGGPGEIAGIPATVGHDRNDALWHRLLLLYEVARWDEASRILDALPADPDSHEHRAMAALLAARRGDAGAALRLDAELVALDEPYLLGAHTVWRARIAAVLGDGDRAVRLLRQAFSEGQDSRLRWALHTDRDFDELRENPAFRAMYTPGPGR